MENIQFNFKNFNAVKNNIIDYLETIENVCREFGKDGDLKRIDSIRSRLRDEKFKVLVVGEFSRGKSTLINSLLGKKILPAKITPCTAVITEILYDEISRAVVHYKDKSKQPLCVGAAKLQETLKEAVVINQKKSLDDISEEDKIRRNPFGKAELFYPIDLCRNGVMIIDSPGLNENLTREEITRRYLSDSDAAVLILGCNMFISAGEMKFITEELQQNLHDNLFFIGNFADLVEEDEDWEDIENRAEEFLTPLLDVPLHQRLFYCSAKNALKAKLDENPKLFEESGVNLFQNALEQYLVKYKTKIKIENSILSIAKIIEQYEKKDFQNRIALLSTSLEDLEQKKQDVLPRFHEAEKQKQRIMQIWQNNKEYAMQSIVTDIWCFFQQLEKKESEFIDNYQFVEFNVIKPRKAIESQLIPALDDYFKREMDRFINDTLVPSVQSKIEAALRQIQEDARKFEHTLLDIRFTFNPEYRLTAEEKEIDPMERIFAAAGGLFLGGIGCATVGGALGFKEMLKSFLPNFGLAFGLAFLGFSPLLIIPALLTLGIYQLFRGKEKMQVKLKQKIKEQIPVMLEENKPKFQADIDKELTGKIDEIGNMIAEGLNNMIDNIKSELENVITQKKQKALEINREKEKIDGYRTRFVNIRTWLNEIRFAFPGKGIN